jgi:hypothetical protein
MFPSLMMLSLEANRVVALRLLKLMRGGKAARREANLMISEKVAAAIRANASLFAGASPEQVVGIYRRRVARNAKRLSKPKLGLKRRRVRRK